MKSYFIEKKTVEGKAWTKVKIFGSQLLTPHKHWQNVTLTLFFQVNPTCATQSLVVTDLIVGEEYLFRVRAENRFGFGPYVETEEGTKAKDPIRMFKFC